jgi:hypothetical protein
MHRGFKRRPPHTEQGSSFSFDEPQARERTKLSREEKQEPTEGQHGREQRTGLLRITSMLSIETEFSLGTTQVVPAAHAPCISRVRKPMVSSTRKGRSWPFLGPEP